MKQRLRTVIFWLHLASGLTAGLIVGLMSFTGAAIAFEPQILEWVERSGPGVAIPAAGAHRLSIDDLLARARAASPAAAPLALTIYPDPGSAVRVSTGRQSGVQVNPYNGEVRPLPGQGWRSFFLTMVELHRWLAVGEDNRAIGRAITGACNSAFLFLALSGLYLWWPRRWNRRVLRASTWFRRGLAGKARDFNWHNVIGFWSLPVLIVITSSGMMISYRWVSNLIYTLAGETPPAGPGGAAAAPVPVPKPPAGARTLGLDALLASTSREVPDWKSVTLRLRGPQRGGAAASTSRGPQALALTVKAAGGWPPFASAQVALDPYTGRILRKEIYDGYTPARKVRSWLRYLHTGEALGWPGQLVAAVVCLGVTLLVWTGFALALRRFLRWRQVVPWGAAWRRNEVENEFHYR